MTDFFSVIIDWYMANINYGTITLLMAIESSFIPFPSEIVVPPAAWKAAQGELNLILVFLSSTAGAMIGAIFNYYLALWLGRPVIYRIADTKWAHLLLINRESIEKAEKYFQEHGRSSTFIGRLVPAIRQLISLPAGLAKMNILAFLTFTFIGSSLWNIILTVLGYFLFSQKSVLEKYYHILSYGCLILGVLFVCWLLYKSFAQKKQKA
jgi:membrane protein DedA with SNARE-associated domain